MSISREEVLACLKTIQAPSGVDLVEAGLVRALTVTEGAVRFVMEVSTPDPFMPAKTEAEEKLTALGCTSVSIVMTAHSQPTAPPNLQPAARPSPQAQKKSPALIGLLQLPLARAALANRLWQQIWPVLWRPKVAGLACWMPTFTAHRSLVCWASQADHKAPMARSSCRYATLASL